jgi:hypothetical protein
MAWRPQVGDLVGVKRLSVKGIVLESREVALTARLFGVLDGAAVVLVEGEQRPYSWADLYLIQDDDADPADA